MTNEEYLAQKKQIQEEAKKKERALDIKYAFANNPYAIGDIVTDSSGSIRISKIRVGFAYLAKFPECNYLGPELKKDGTLKKSGAENTIWQSQIIPKT